MGGGAAVCTVAGLRGIEDDSVAEYDEEVLRDIEEQEP